MRDDEVREEGDDAAEHRHGAKAEIRLLLASCSDRSRVRLRPPAGAPPSPPAARTSRLRSARGGGGAVGRGGPAGRAGAQGRAPGGDARRPGPPRPSARPHRARSLRAGVGAAARGGAPAGLARVLVPPPAKGPQLLLFSALQSKSSPNWIR